MIENKLVGNGVIDQAERTLLKSYGLAFTAQERAFIRIGGRTVLNQIVANKIAGLHQ